MNGEHESALTMRTPETAEGGVRTPVLWAFALVVGLLAALATTGFRWLITGVEWLGTGHTGSLVEAARHLPPWQRMLVGTVGGVLAGCVLWWGGRWAARGRSGAHHVDYIEAARRGRAELNDRTTITRSASALLSVATGASIGREGAMVQLAAWFSTLLARWAPLSWIFLPDCCYLWRITYPILLKVSWMQSRQQPSICFVVIRLAWLRIC